MSRPVVCRSHDTLARLASAESSGRPFAFGVERRQARRSSLAAAPLGHARMRAKRLGSMLRFVNISTVRSGSSSRMRSSKRLIPLTPPRPKLWQLAETRAPSCRKAARLDPQLSIQYARARDRAASASETRATRFRSSPRPAPGRPKPAEQTNRAKVSWERHTTGPDNVVDAADKNQ